MCGSLRSMYSRRRHSSGSLAHNSSRQCPSAELGSARIWEVPLARDSRVARSLLEASMCRLPGIPTSGVYIAARLRHKGLKSQVWAQRAVRMTLVQQVATAYFQLRAYDEQLQIAKETLKDRQESVALTRALVYGGSDPLSDLRQAEENEYTASAQIPQLEQEIQQQEKALRLLLGQNPGPVAHTDPNALAPVPQNLPVGLPSRLLERRPDILEAEQQLVQANANIGVARAQFFAQLSISTSGGVGGSDPSNPMIYGIGSLTQPIFEGGKLRGQLQLSEETKKEMVLDYQNTIATDFQGVSNALIAVNKQRAAREQQEKLVAAAEDAARLASIQFQAGATSYLPVLTTDAVLFSAQLSLVNAREGEALSLVQLYEGLGGGWE